MQLWLTLREEQLPGFVSSIEITHTTLAACHMTRRILLLHAGTVRKTNDTSYSGLGLHGDLSPISSLWGSALIMFQTQWPSQPSPFMEDPSEGTAAVSCVPVCHMAAAYDDLHFRDEREKGSDGGSSKRRSGVSERRKR